jgi:hypothetical protein
MESCGGQAYSKKNVQWSVLECQIQRRVWCEAMEKCRRSALQSVCPEIGGTRHPVQMHQMPPVVCARGVYVARRVCRGCGANHVRTCCICNKDKASTDFTNSMWARVISRRICKECMLGRTCCICEKPHTECKFAFGQWIKPDAQRICIQCTKHRCSMCKKEKGKLQFSRQQSAMNATDRLCYDCDRRRCSLCNKEKGYKDLSHAVWDLDVGSPELLRTQCVAGQRKHGFWECANKRCGKQKPHSEFGRAIAKFGQEVRGNPRQCDACLERREEELAEMMRSSLDHVQKKRKQHLFNNHLKHACSVQCKCPSRSSLMPGD